jgi:hypothetical protein
MVCVQGRILLDWSFLPTNDEDLIEILLLDYLMRLAQIKRFNNPNI